MLWDNNLPMTEKARR